MFKNYFKTAWRNLMRNPRISLINVGGLAIGIACAIILYLLQIVNLVTIPIIQNADRIYKLYAHIDLNGVASNSVPHVRNNFN